MTAPPPSEVPTTLAGKLDLLLRRLAVTIGHTPSVRELAARTAPADGDPPSLSHAVINDLLNGRKTNPPCTTIQAVAQAFDAPAAYLLPGWDDLTGLTAYQQEPGIREAVRLVAGLGPEAAAELVAAARDIRARRSLSTAPVPEVPDVPPLAPEPTRPGRRRGGRRSDTEMAARAADN
ncbi:hypothetical protein E6W39_28985 [Kitasatospora acidiphila]|uniref:HTH cro/C1-type domain-containing protein n=1 Tax=Kitasatospora acidiphila TaxID=2567942 RepID=A0A540WAT5_9ACTN|nr:hypothetical protein [Kitasatospora acidiphila]TQF05524.1 hypothetical protein E6W39_28985 [Kitasatospora acidiphila]